ncbi:hypothetical protein KKF84_13595 [Myxococcota bacterium]|nr:hypothetical protein [Myxococcota bacterium]
MKVTLFIAAILSLSACHKSASEAEKRNDFLMEVVTRKCERILSCCDQGYALMGTTYDTVAECQMYEAMMMDVQFPPDKTGFDQAGADAYSEWLDANLADCGEDVSGYFYTNDLRMLRYAVPYHGVAGSTCQYYWECDPDLTCYDNRCAYQSGLGGVCDISIDCELGLECVWSTCGLLQTAGDDCINDRCYGDFLYCDTVSSLCVEQKHHGEACSEDAECQSRECTPEGTCNEDSTFEYHYCYDPQ